MQSKLLKDDVAEKFDEEYEEPFMSRIDKWWWKLMGLRIKDFTDSCKSIIKWWPTIWKDRDYDHSFILEILKKKIYFTAKLHIQNQRYEGWEREVELMTLCVKLLDYVRNDHYTDLASDWLNEKYGESKFDFGSEVENGYHSMWFLYPNIENGTYTQEEYDKDFREKFAEAELKHNKAKKLAFKILDEHIEHWWD